jgi:WD40 repeat protein
MRLLPVRSGHIERLAYSPDGSHLAASAHLWGRVWLWDLRRGDVLCLEDPRRTTSRPYAFPAESAASLAYSGSGNRLAIGRQGQAGFRLSHIGEQHYFLNALGHHSRQLAFTPDEQTLVSAGVDRSNLSHAGWPPAVVLWDVASARKRSLSTPLPAGTQALAIAPDASLVLWCEPPAPRAPAHLTLWHVLARQPLARLGINTPPACAAFSPGGRRFAVAVEENILLYEIGHVLDFLGAALGAGPWASLTLPFWWKRLASRRVPIGNPRQLEGHQERVLALAFTPDGEALLSGGRDRTVRCWDLASLRQREAWSWPVGVVYSLAVAPDGLTAAAGGNAGRTVVWDLAWF